MASSSVSPSPSTGHGAISMPARSMTCGRSVRYPRNRVRRRRSRDRSASASSAAAFRADARDLEGPAVLGESGRRECADPHIGALLGLEALRDEHHPIAQGAVAQRTVLDACVHDGAAAVDGVGDGVADRDLRVEAPPHESADRHRADPAPRLREVPRRDDDRASRPRGRTRAPRPRRCRPPSYACSRRRTGRRDAAPRATTSTVRAAGMWSMPAAARAGRIRSVSPPMTVTRVAGGGLCEREPQHELLDAREPV